MLCGFCPHFRLPCKSLIFTHNPSLYTPMSLGSPPNDLLFTPISYFGFVPLSSAPSVCWARGEKLEVGVDSSGSVHADVCNAILAQDIYCAKPNPDLDDQSSTRVIKGFGALAMRSTLEYDLATANAIQTLTQPLTCKMGLSIFADMS